MYPKLKPFGARMQDRGTGRRRGDWGFAMRIQSLSGAVAEVVDAGVCHTPGLSGRAGSSPVRPTLKNERPRLSRPGLETVAGCLSGTSSLSPSGRGCKVMEPEARRKSQARGGSQAIIQAGSAGPKGEMVADRPMIERRGPGPWSGWRPKRPPYGSAWEGGRRKKRLARAERIPYKRQTPGGAGNVTGCHSPPARSGAGNPGDAPGGLLSDQVSKRL